jgi:hypothetical protein
VIHQLREPGIALFLIAAAGCLAPTAEVLGPGATATTTTGGSISAAAPDAGAEDDGSPPDGGTPDSGWAPDSGVPAQPAILCSPLGLDFGLNAVGITSTERVLCTNAGRGNLFIGDASSGASGLSIGDRAFSAAFDQPFPVAGLASGESIVIDVTYAPSAGGIDTDTLVISSNDPVVPETHVAMTGTAKQLPGDCSEFSVQPTRVDLGDIAPGVAVTFPLEIINPGVDECLINALSISNFPCPPESNPFSLPDYPAGSSTSVIISPGGTLEIQVQLILTVPGPWAGEIDLSFTPKKIPVTANVL